MFLLGGEFVRLGDSACWSAVEAGQQWLEDSLELMLANAGCRVTSVVPLLLLMPEVSTVALLRCFA